MRTVCWNILSTFSRWFGASSIVLARLRLKLLPMLDPLSLLSSSNPLLARCLRAFARTVDLRRQSASRHLLPYRRSRMYRRNSSASLLTSSRCTCSCVCVTVCETVYSKYCRRNPEVESSSISRARRSKMSAAVGCETVVLPALRKSSKLDPLRSGLGTRGLCW